MRVTSVRTYTDYQAIGLSFDLKTQSPVNVSSIFHFHLYLNIEFIVECFGFRILLASVRERSFFVPHLN